MANSLLSRRIVSWIVSFGLYSPIRVVSEPEVPIFVPFTAVMMSLSLRPAFEAGELGEMAEVL